MRWLLALIALAGCGRIHFAPQAEHDAAATCTPAVAVSALAAGDDFLCAQLADGTLRCWGDGASGQLGDGTGLTQIDPVTPVGLGPVASFSTGVMHACAVAGGTARCWGSNHMGQLGLGDDTDRPQPTDVPLPDVVGVAAGGLNTCAWTGTHELWCWGQYNGTSGGSSQTPVKVATNVASASLNTTQDIYSAAHGCAIALDGSLSCWGDNSAGQLGDGTMTTSNTPVPVGIANVAQVALGDFFSCARISDGSVSCWGDNNTGQLGDGTTIPQLTPHPVPGLSGIAEIGAHSYTACARTTAGDVWCWGTDRDGELPVATDADLLVTSPAKIAIPPARSLAVGATHSCAIADDGVVWCWGTERTGRAIYTQAVTVAGLANVDQIAAGQGDSTCAHRTDGSIACWGHNSFGQLGDGTRGDRSSPVDVTMATEVAMGREHTCARHADGTVSCWGINVGGQVGASPATSVVLPSLVAGLGGSALHVTAGSEQTCALLATSEVWCWGTNDEGRVAALSGGSGRLPPSATGFPASGALASGDCGSCAIAKTKQVFCAGRGNEGEMGDGTGNDLSYPGQVANLPATATAISVGYSQACAIASGSLWCWGDNVHGEVGDGLPSNRAKPVQLSFPGPTAIATGFEHTCAIAGTTVWCWGDNASGQLGDGTLASSRVPVLATELAGSTQLALGRSHTCARMPDGSVRCVGSDAFGQLGTGAPPITAAPRTAALTCP